MERFRRNLDWVPERDLRGRSGGVDEGFGAVDSLAFRWGVEGIPEVGAALVVEPEVRGVAEDAGEDEGGGGLAFG